MTPDPEVEIVASIIEDYLRGAVLKSDRPLCAIRILSALRDRGWVKDEWLPIESAPRDGTVFWAYDPQKFREQFQARFIEDGRCHNLSENYWANPTHWMPLPGAPQTEAGASDG